MHHDMPSKYHGCAESFVTVQAVEGLATLVHSQVAWHFITIDLIETDWTRSLCVARPLHEVLEESLMMWTHSNKVALWVFGILLQ